MINLLATKTRWNKITKMLKLAAENTIGYVNKSRKYINEEVKELSLLQRSIKIQIKSCINEEFFHNEEMNIL